MNLPAHSSLSSLEEKARFYLDFLCVTLPTRRVGSSGNQDATAFAARLLESLGYQVETPCFDCIDWVTQGAACTAGSLTFPVFSSPYSTGCDVTAALRAAGTLEELMAIQCCDEILLLHGDLAREQLMPKNFSFYNPEHHQLIIALLEEKNPAAIITATGLNPELAGAVYPFPLIEDGDFTIPSVYTTNIIGGKIANLCGQTFHLVSCAERIPSSGCNVLGRRNPHAAEKIVICAHIDAKMGTPGALDNAAGVITLLLAAEQLRNYDGGYELEFLVMNGEDYYGANGEKLYLERNPPGAGSIPLFINMDGLGYIKGNTAVSFYNLTEAIRAAFSRLLTGYPGMIEGEPWYQGDHMIMVMNGVPAVALTTEHFVELEAKYAHTEKDVPALVDVDKLIAASLVVRDLVQVFQPG